MKARTVIHWFRRDLRLTDNPALAAAAKAADCVIPVYILSDWKGDHSWTGNKRQKFLCDCLESLATDLGNIGSKLILRTGRADLVLEELLRESGAQALYFNRDYEPHGRAIETALAAVCGRLGIECNGFKDRVLHEAAEVRTGSGTGYRVFTPYWRNWNSLPKAAPGAALRALGSPGTVRSDPLPSVAHWQLDEPQPNVILPAGEHAARQRMIDFVEGNRLPGYAKTRDLPAGCTTSRLGQDLRFGLISIRELFARCREADNATGTFVKELAWREFYMAILHDHPEVFEVEFNPEFRGMPWEGIDAHFEAWANGRTGFPIVDAGIRQLLATGFMHNRVRMIVAMFLTKDLHCDWRAGESFFMQHLVDGESSSNNCGWQWSAGTGADAAPYFRIQNPWTQTRRYDPEGRYIKTWVPELKNVESARFQAPPKEGQPLAPDYPLPIVDHALERQRALAIYSRHLRR